MKDQHSRDLFILRLMFVLSAVAVVAMFLLFFLSTVEKAACPHTPSRLFWFFFGASAVGGWGAFARMTFGWSAAMAERKRVEERAKAQETEDTP